MRDSLRSWWADNAPRLGTERLALIMLAASLAGSWDAGGATLASERPDAATANVVANRGIVACQGAALPPTEAFSLPPEDAIEWFQHQRIVTPEEWAELDGMARARAFTARELADQAVLEQTYLRIERALTDGWTVERWLKSLEHQLELMGVTGTDPHYLRLVFRQNVSTAYSAGRWRQFQRTKRTRPYLQYWTAGDDRVRPAHAALHGVIRPVDDAFWHSHYPPWDYACRCQTVSVSIIEMEDEDLHETTDEEIGEAMQRQTGGSAFQLPAPPSGFGDARVYSRSEP